MRDGETDHRTVRQIDRTLHETLAKGTAAYNDTTILILNSTCHNLCCRCRIAIHQHHHLALLEGTVAIGGIVHSWHLTTFGIDDQVTLFQKLLRDIHSSLQIAAAVLLQVEYQMLHTLCLQLVQTLHEFLMRSGTETPDADIADTRTDHIGGID